MLTRVGINAYSNALIFLDFVYDVIFLGAANENSSLVKMFNGGYRVIYLLL